MQQNMAYVLLAASLLVLSFGVFNIKRNLAKKVEYDFWGDFKRTFFKIRMRYENTQRKEDCNLIIPAFQTLLGIVLFTMAIYRLGAR